MNTRHFALATDLGRTRVDHTCALCESRIRRGTYGVVKVVGRTDHGFATAHLHGDCYEATSQVAHEVLAEAQTGELHDAYQDGQYNSTLRRLARYY